MIELELFNSQLSSIMEVLVRSAIADIGKLMEDYTVSLLETSRGRRESEAMKSKPVQSDQRDTKSSGKECRPIALDQRLEENCRSDTDQVVVTDFGHRKFIREILSLQVKHSVSSSIFQIILFFSFLARQ